MSLFFESHDDVAKRVRLESEHCLTRCEALLDAEGARLAAVRQALDETERTRLVSPEKLAPFRHELAAFQSYYEERRREFEQFRARHIAEREFLLEEQEEEENVLKN